MTVNEYKETTCATAGQVEDMEVEENILPIVHQSQEGENENLLGRVLAGNLKNCCSLLLNSSV